MAEQLFMERGYPGVKLKHIADALDIKQASLYYHFPGGKQAMFTAVVRRALQRHRDGLEEAIKEAGDDWQAQARAIALWIISQPPMDLFRMVNSDLPAISKETADQLMWESFNTMILPLQRIFAYANTHDDVRQQDPGLMAGMFISIISGVQQVRDEWSEMSKYEMIDQALDVMIYGMKKR